MKIFQRAFWLILVSLGMTGCFTPTLHYKLKHDAFYSEVVSSMHLSEDRKQLIFIGSDYYYIFDAPAELLNSLDSPFQKSLFAEFRGFRSDINNHIIGNLTITLDESASREDIENVVELGYEKQVGHPTLMLPLQGKRYRSEYITTGEAEYKLNYTYKITVWEERGSIEKATYTALIPVAVVADGVAICIIIPLIILGGITPH